MNYWSTNHCWMELECVIGVSNETNTDVRMYTWRIYSNRYLDTLLYTDGSELKMHGICSSLYTNATIEEKGWDCSQMYNWHCRVNRITMKWEPVNLRELMCELPFHCLACSCHLEVLIVISIDSLLIKQLRKLLNVILVISLFTWQDVWRDNCILENMSSWHLNRYVFWPISQQFADWARKPWQIAVLCRTLWRSWHTFSQVFLH